MSSQINVGAVTSYLRNLQDTICNALTDIDDSQYTQDNWQRKDKQEDFSAGGGITRAFESDSSSGEIIAKGGVNFSHIYGSELPSSATTTRPELTGRTYEAMGVSVVMHPHNPYVPTSHANVRFFVAHETGKDPIWWFGGGFDLTPYYGFEQDCIHWHQMARNACKPFEKDDSDGLYRQLKQQCDDYFYLPHRNEPRGIGGLFYDNFNQWEFEQSFAFMRSVGSHYLKAYMPIIKRRRDTPFGKKEIDFQQYRRGRYVEFNLLQDRGTLFGIQSGGRTESILMSMPPNVQWRYNWSPEKGSLEYGLLTDFLVKGKNWI